MIDDQDKVPEDVQGELEKLVLGEGPFEDAEVLELLETESPEAEPEAPSREMEVEARLSALEQGLLDVPGIPGPILLPDQNIEFGLADAFSSGATVTITPCDMDGNVTGEDDVTVYVKADRQSATVTIDDQAVVTWMRFDERTTTGTVAGVLVGSLFYEDSDTDEKVSSQSGCTAGYLSDVLTLKNSASADTENLGIALDGDDLEIWHVGAGAQCTWLDVCVCTVACTLQFDADGHFKGFPPP